MTADTATENPFESLRNTIAFDSLDYSRDKRMAWLYGIVLGWGRDSMDDEDARAEIAAQHRFTTSEMDRLDRLHAAFKAAEREFTT